jgi:hypothetical protein
METDRGRGPIRPQARGMMHAGRMAVDKSGNEVKKTMQAGQFAKSLPNTIAVIPALAVIFAVAAPSSVGTGSSQDQTFRLMNIERRLDQLQSRMDSIDRMLQNQAMSNINSSNLSTEAMLELQRQQLSLAEQVVMMQKRMLDMQKAIDQLRSREPGVEKSEKPKEEARPRVQPKKP